MSVEPDYCPVCRGDKRIHLPLYHQVCAVEADDLGKLPVIDENSRYYDCPECVKKVPYRRVTATKVMAFMDSLQTNDRDKALWREYAMRSMVRTITEKLIREGVIQFEPTAPDAYHPEGICATIRAVMPKDVATFEERVAERQMDIATEVAEEAKRRIENWGSYYTIHSIAKDEAHRQISNAVEHVRERRKK